MRSFTCVSVVACVVRKVRPCPSYSRRRDRINLGLWRGLYAGGGGYVQTPKFPASGIGSYEIFFWILLRLLLQFHAADSRCGNTLSATSKNREC